MIEFLDYDVKYPSLIFDIVDYFTLGNGNINSKKVISFCTDYKVPQGEDLIQPDVVDKIRQKLCSARKMSCIKSGGAIGGDSNYLVVIRDRNQYHKNKDYYVFYYNSLVYGFEYIYHEYRAKVIPLVVKTKEGESMGTCFRMYNGLVTAKHCLTDGCAIAVQGYTGEFLNKCNVYVSSNADIDLAYIETCEDNGFFEDEGHVLDDVLVMGYPKVSFFLNFCTAERAIISAKAELRMTPTMGAIAAKGEIYFPKGLPELFLITAKIRGGNSGGPVINSKGMVVGVATGISAGEGLSDDNVGYGMAYPIQTIRDMIREKNYVAFDFVDFPE